MGDLLPISAPVRDEQDAVGVRPGVGLLESVADGFVALSFEGRFVYASEQGARLLGYPREQLLGAPLLEGWPEARGAIEGELRRAIEERVAVWFELERAAGILQCRVYPSAEGLSIQLSDVTQERRAQRRLAASEARLGLLSRTAAQLLASDAPQGVVEALCREVMLHLDCQVFFNYLLDPGTGRLRLNACAGVSAEAAAQLEWLDVGAALCGCAARDAEPVVAEAVQRSSDPRAALVRGLGVDAYCAHPLLVQGKAVGTLSFGTRTRARFQPDELELMRTVTDQVATAMQRVEAQRALALANARLLEADRKKNDFLGVLSHELRNPLAPIRNSLHLLERAPPGSEVAERARRIIERQVTHLSNLVDDLLDVTRITRGKIQLVRERLELGEAVRRTAEDCRSLFEEAAVRLELALDPQPLHVNADRTRLAQIVGNLLQNAAKFAGRGGWARIATAAEGEAAVLRVADGGVGMAPEVLRSVFEPFVQADQALDRTQGGLGLGLALVKGLVELHGGEVSARSAGPGRGAELVVRLPRCAAPAAPLRRPAPAGAPPRRVLVVEDNVDAAQSLRDVLELAGHTVEVAHDGPSALARARAFLPEYVFCDIGLPGMDGFAVARAFCAEAALRGAYLVALTGYALPEDQARAAEAGFRRHMAKPPSLEAIEELLRGQATMFPRDRAR